jgi:hypothetical protein
MSPEGLNLGLAARTNAESPDGLLNIESRLCYHPRSSRGTQCPLQSGGEGDTALSDGSQNGIDICASDHVVVIIAAIGSDDGTQIGHTLNPNPKP